MNIDAPIEKIIYMLEISRHHEGMIFGTSDIAGIINAFSIMHMVCRAFNVHFEQQWFQSSVEAHG